MKTITPEEAAELHTVVEELEAQPEDPKIEAVLQYLLGKPQWLKRYGCIVFSQYFDTTDWVARTIAEVVYDRLSQRMKDRYDLFGSLPDVIEDDWIDDLEHLDEKLSEFIERRQAARSAFDLRYGDTMDVEAEPWEKCCKVLSRRNLEEALSRGW